MNKELNFEQSSVINELDENILLIASAGTGKTDTLAKRIVNIINSKKCLADEILCITFTNKACREMKDRIEEEGVNETKGINIKTFHAFCLQIIKENAKKSTDTFSDFTILDEDDSKELLRQFNRKGYPIEALYRFVMLVKEYRIKLNNFSEDYNEDYKKTIDSLFKCNSSLIDDMCTVKKVLNSALKASLRDYGHILIYKHNSALKTNHMLDFSDLIMEAKLLFEDSDIVNDYANRYKYICIDEMQDTSIIEYHIIEKIFSNNNILLCGDIFQTIYEWRGSEPNLIQNEFLKHNPKVIKFYKNYRATKILTEASLKYLESTFKFEYSSIYSKPIESNTITNGNKIYCHGSHNREEEAFWIKDNIDKILSEDVIDEKTCILTRDNFLNIDLSRELKKFNKNNKYEFVLVDQFKFFRREEIKDITAFLKLIVNRNDDISLKRILKRLPTGIGDNTINLIQSEEYKKVGIKLTDFIQVEENEEYFSKLIEAYNNDGTIIVFDVESTGVNVTKDEIIQIAAIKIDKNGDVVETFERFVKPNKSVGKSALVHGFTDDYLERNGESKEKVFSEFLDFSDNAIIVGHNVQYDISILASELNRINMRKYNFKGVFDTLDIFRRFYPNLPNHKLETLSKIFPISHEPSHNALDDVKATSYLLILSLKEKIIPNAATRFLYTNKVYKKFSNISLKINKLIENSEKLRPSDIINYILEEFSLCKVYGIEEREEKINRINDFKDFLEKYYNKNDSNIDLLIQVVNLTSLSNGELEELMIDKSNKIRIPILTIHQAKGLEYDNVFLAGLEENRFPSFRAVNSGDLSEESRTFYVAITRAKKNLYLSYTTTNSFGYPTYPSRFINAIPKEYINIE